MDKSTVLISLISAVSAVIAAIVGGMYTYRASRKNSEATRTIEREKLSTDSWERQVKAWREDVVTLRAQRAEDTRMFEEHRRSCAQMVEELETSVRETRHQIKLLASWINVVLPLLHRHNIPFPPLPESVADFEE